MKAQFTSEGISYKREPMSEARFKAVCRVAYTAIGMIGTIAAVKYVGFMALAVILPVAFVTMCVIKGMED